MFIKFRRRQRTLAMTLAEVIIATGIGGIVLAAIAAMSFYTARSMAAMSNYSDLDRQSRNALDQMSYKIRSSDRLTAFTSTNLVFLYKGQALRYAFSSSAKTLTESYGSTTKVLLNDCGSLTFSVFQRNVVSNSFSQVTTTDTNEAKSIIVTWTCSRSLLGNLINSESVQSARIVIRNNP